MLKKTALFLHEGFPYGQQNQALAGLHHKISVRSRIYFSPTAFISKVCVLPPNPNSIFHIVLKVIPLGAKLFPWKLLVLLYRTGVVEFGLLLASTKMDQEIFVLRVFVIRYNMQYIPCNSALLAQETLFLTQKGTFYAQRSREKKCINRDKS